MPRPNIYAYRPSALARRTIHHRLLAYSATPTSFLNDLNAPFSLSTAGPLVALSVNNIGLAAHGPIGVCWFWSKAKRSAIDDAGDHADARLLSHLSKP
jgi:hypothetical protein